MSFASKKIGRLVLSSLGLVALMGGLIAFPAQAAPPAPSPEQSIPAPAAAPEPRALAVCTTYMTVQAAPSTITVPSLGSANTLNNRRCQLGLNNSSSAVTRLQYAVAHCNANYNLGTIDGIYGTKTKNAVAAAQKKYALPQDGLYGPQTHNKLYFHPPAETGLCYTDVNKI